MEEFFKGLKVLELANVLAGPAVGLFFAELGAEVIKIENSRTNGDMTRHWKLPTEDKKSSVSAYFSSINYKKTHLHRDLSDADDLREVLQLIADCDILISNFKSGSAARFGLDTDSLKEKYPALIQAQITGFKSESKKTAFDAVLQAETGFLSMCGQDELELSKMPVALIDVLTAHQVKEGILMALLKRERSGKGSIISCSLEETAFASLMNQASNYLMTGHVARPMGTLHPNIAPYGELVSTQDDVSFILAIGTDGQFSNLCHLLGLNDLKKDARFLTNKERVTHRTELHQLLIPEVKQWMASAFEKECMDHAIPAGRVKKIDEALESPLAKEMVLEEIIDGVLTKRLRSVSFLLT